MLNTLAGMYPDSFLLLETFNFKERCPKVDWWFGFPHFLQQTQHRHPDCRSDTNEPGTLTTPRKACYL